jgi:hypothetical protein
MTMFLKWSSTGILSYVLTYNLCTTCRIQSLSRNSQHAEDAEISDPIRRAKGLRSHSCAGLASGYLLRSSEQSDMVRASLRVLCLSAAVQSHASRSARFAFHVNVTKLYANTFCEAFFLRL